MYVIFPKFYQTLTDNCRVEMKLRIFIVDSPKEDSENEDSINSPPKHLNKSNNKDPKSNARSPKKAKKSKIQCKGHEQKQAKQKQKQKKQQIVYDHNKHFVTSNKHIDNNGR